MAEIKTSQEETVAERLITGRESFSAVETAPPQHAPGKSSGKNVMFQGVEGVGGGDGGGGGGGKLIQRGGAEAEGAILGCNNVSDGSLPGHSRPGVSKTLLSPESSDGPKTVDEKKSCSMQEKMRHGGLRFSWSQGQHTKKVPYWIVPDSWAKDPAFLDRGTVTKRVGCLLAHCQNRAYRGPAAFLEREVIKRVGCLLVHSQLDRVCLRNHGPLDVYVKDHCTYISSSCLHARSSELDLNHIKGVIVL